MSVYPDRDEPPPTTVTGHIKAFLSGVSLARELRAGYTDQAAINREYERAVAAEAATAKAAWAEMRADGVPVAEPEPEAGPEPLPEPEPEAEL